MDYYPIRVLWCNNGYYAIYIMADQDAIYSYNGVLLLFYSMESLLRFVNKEKLRNFHNAKVATFDIDYIHQFVLDKLQDVNFKELLDVWDLFDDLAEDQYFIDKEYTSLSVDSRWLHAKLVYSIDMFSDRDVVSKPWTSSEFDELKEIFKVGLRFFGEVMRRASKLA